ncbi:aminotransferase class I/II-fold pyridoxal phosphate-dependent enzyme [Brumicola nitratireducens]|uniref:8-amino-7-oxononanoate synthase n=1 Tax=Glaciecola nitratireducens (strain JCM 12485 / KCTC 12276 / FR1064) TaxID=1085623 RepID=G4QGF1_GLANF|nr:8-amino-7-oxononanoate synthase [Glaciecola nitratireducens]AEP29476.1 8-amino-7-oxononanoate synthase [Glaciecola nitratireducens FR1064]
MPFDFIKAALEQRAADSLLRKRVEVANNSQAIIEVDGNHYINFSSNDYLGLSQHQDVLQSFAEGLSLYGASSSASSVVTGYSREHRLLEEDICEHTQFDNALLFSSGFAANQAVCQALFQTANFNNDTARYVIADKLMHASFIDSAMQLNNGQKNPIFSRFRHNDMQHLQSKLVQGADNLVVTEGIFSMDGNRGDIQGIKATLDDAKSSAWLMVDDAHAIGCVGENGMGSTTIPIASAKADASLGSLQTKARSQRKVDVLMGTFGKAIGTQGSFVAGSNDFIEYLVNFSKHYVYSTAIPAAQARATRTSLQIMRKGIEREMLHQNISKFKGLAIAAGLPILPVDGPIQPIIIGDPTKALAISQHLKSLGIWVNAIRSPTVPKHSDRLRITLSALHQTQDIQALVDALSLSMASMQAESTS